MNSIMYYGTQILKDAGFETKAALIGNIANGVISVLATFVGIWLLGKVGRRPMLMTGLIGTTAVVAFDRSSVCRAERIACSSLCGSFINSHFPCVSAGGCLSGDLADAVGDIPASIAGAWYGGSLSSASGS